MHGVYDYIITHNFKIGLKYFQPIIDVPNLALLTYNNFFFEEIVNLDEPIEKMSTDGLIAFLRPHL